MNINDTIRVKETGHTMQITEISEQGAYKLDNGIWYGSNEVEPASLPYTCQNKRCDQYGATLDNTHHAHCLSCGSALVVKEAGRRVGSVR